MSVGSSSNQRHLAWRAARSTASVVMPAVDEERPSLVASVAETQMSLEVWVENKLLGSTEGIYWVYGMLGSRGVSNE